MCYTVPPKGGEDMRVEHMGQRLAKELKQRNLTKAEFARRCGFTKQWTSEICGSKTWEVPTLLRVAKALEVEPMTLVTVKP